MAVPVNTQHDKLESLLARLAQRVEALGLESLQPHEQVALIAYTAHGVVSREGLKQFYAGKTPLSGLVSALRALNLKPLATAAAATAALFPDAALADDPVARRPYLAELDTAKADYVFFRLSSEELLDAIAAFWKRSAKLAQS